MQELEQVAKESYRVLKKQGICAFMIGDIRKKGYVLPLGMNSMQKFVDAGFKLKLIKYTTGATNTKERVIKRIEYCKNKFEG